MAEKSRKPKIRFAGFTEDWEQRKFGDIVIRSSTMAVCSSDLPSVEYEDIISEQGILNKDVRAKGTVKTGIKFLPGNILFGKLRPYLRNWLLPDFSGVAVGDFWVLQPSEADSRYLYYLIQTPAFQEATNQSTGTKMPRADWNLVSKSVFFLPRSGEEQVKIGLALQAVDRLITLHQRKRDRLVNIKKAMLEKMFPKNGADVPEVRFAGFTEAWEQRKLGEITTELTQYATFQSGFPLLTSSRSGLMFQEEYRSNLSTDNSNTLFSVVPEWSCTYRHMSDDDIFHFNINKIAEKGLVSREYPVFIADSENILSVIITYLNSSSSFRRFCAEQKMGGTRTRLYYKKLCSFMLKLPHREEQNKIDSFFRHLDHLITLHQRKVELLQNIKKACLEAMFV